MAVLLDRPPPGAHHGVEMGATGTIVEVYSTAYEVEIDDEAGRVIFLGPIDDDDLELVEE